MAFTFATYEKATTPAQGPTPGARSLMAYCLARWGFASSLGIFAVRNVVGGTDLSHHAEGRALDIGIPMPGPSKADHPKGMQVVDALGPVGQRLGIDHLIFDRTIWSGRAPDGRPYTGQNPHYDHVHLGLTRNAGQNLNPATIEAVLGGGSVAGPELERPTHVVTASSLRLRSEPSTTAAVITSLGRDTPVEQLADAPREAEGHTWVKIRAAAGGGLQEGWVAGEYLESTGAAPPATVQLDRVTHRVDASSLRLRTEPSTTADVAADLARDSEVEQLPVPPEDADGFTWVKVRAVVTGRRQEGWVADKFLDPVA
jgi:Bacterial SH3 domain